MPSTTSPNASPGKKVKSKSKPASKGRIKGEKAVSPCGQKQKKTRRAPLGPRGQSQSCHQCRQSIHSSKGVSEVKSGQERLKCSTCTRYWCEQCLQNRYGIAQGSVERDSWSCPVCNKNCNCSICRKKAGKLATGILTPLVKNAGYDCVSEFLTKGTDDIAKCLQWSSPDTTQRPSGGGQSQKKQKPPAKPTSPSRKRKRRTSQRENTELQTDVSDEPLTPAVSRDSECNGGPGSAVANNCEEGASNHLEASCCHRDTGGCHGNSPKRRKLKHSSYSITMEEEELQLREAAVTKEFEDATPSGQTVPKEVKEDSPPSVDDLIAFGDALRRSPRRRAKTVKFAAEDFKEKPDSPKGSRKRRRNGEKSAQQDDTEATRQMLDELEVLKATQLDTIRSQKMANRRKTMEAKAERREAERCRKEEARQERVREVDAQGRQRGEVRQQLRLARSIVREAQKERLRRDREKTRVKKQRELLELKQRKASERRRKQELVSVPPLSAPVSTVPAAADDDSPQACEDAGIPDLPALPGLDFTLPQSLVPQLLFVSEFLRTFAEPLRLKKKTTAGSLLTSLSSGRGLSIVYQRLLQATRDPEGDSEAGLGSSRKLKALEGVAKEYLHQAGRNGFAAPCGGNPGDGLSLEGSLLVLENLCLEALDRPCIVEHLEAMRDRCEEVRREGRLREREKTREIGERLRGLCEQGCSMEELEERRDEVTTELAQIRSAMQREQYALSLGVRNLCLGEDRHGRSYWRLQSVPGIVVGPPLASEADALGDSQADSGSWYVINSEKVLTTLMECLHPAGRREKPLYEALHFHRSDVLATLGRAKKEVTAQRFYGSSASQQ